MFTRRSAAKLLGALPGALPLARHALPETLNTQISAGLLGGGVAESCQAPANYPGQGQTSSFRMPEHEAFKILLKDPFIRAQYESNLFAENRTVNFVDPDIMVYKSFSPMAKITFQRQRNVSRAIEMNSNEPPWMRNNWFYGKIKSLMSG